MLMPQEIEVWYVLPALRKELAKIMVSEMKLSQKQAAEILGVTESAISQYKTAKRASRVQFDEKTLAELRKSAKRIAKDKSLLMREMVQLSKNIRKSQVLCKIHRSVDTVPRVCAACARP